MGEEIIAQIELDIAGDADDDPARQEEKDCPYGCYFQHLPGEVQYFRRGDAGVQIVNGVADYLGQEHPCPVAQKNAQNARHEPPAVALEIGQVWTQILGTHADF